MITRTAEVSSLITGTTGTAIETNLFLLKLYPMVHPLAIDEIRREQSRV
jgi:hypothetical protein